jgi:hypothetical protein
MRDPRLDESKEVCEVEGQQSTYSIKDCLVETTTEMKERYVSNVLMTMAMWFPVESMNLRYTPLHLRSIVAGAVGLLWTTGMAAWTHTGSRSLMESNMEPNMEPSMEPSMWLNMEPSIASSMESLKDSWRVVKTLLARVSYTTIVYDD